MGDVVQFNPNRKKKEKQAIGSELCRFFHLVTRFFGTERFYHLCKKKPYKRKPDENGIVRSWHKDGVVVVDEERAYEHCVFCYKEEGRCRLFKPKFPDRLDLNVQRSA